MANATIIPEYEKSLLENAYEAFNTRNIDRALKAMHPDVDWPNGMTGGIEHGHLEVRNYWTWQWQIINPHVIPVNFNVDEKGRIIVTVHQIVHEINGKLLSDEVIYHVYSMENGLIKKMEIQKAKTL